MRMSRLPVVVAAVSMMVVMGTPMAADDSARVTYLTGRLMDSELTGLEDFWAETGAVAHSRGRTRKCTSAPALATGQGGASVRLSGNAVH